MTPGMSSWAIVSHPGSLLVIFDPSGVNNSSVSLELPPAYPQPQHVQLRHIRFLTFSDDFFFNFVFPGLFGHNWGPLKKKKNENIFFCRLGKSTSIRAIDLAVQRMLGLPASIKAPALAATGGCAVAQLIAPVPGTRIWAFLANMGTFGISPYKGPFSIHFFVCYW